MAEEYPVVYMQDDIEVTEKQKEALKVAAQKWRGVQVYHRSYGLPEGYISITLDPNRHPMIGGMDKDGVIST